MGITSVPDRPVRAIAAVAFVVAAIGVFGPWVTVFGGVGKLNGTDGDGWMALAAALLSAGLLVWKPRALWAVLIALLGAIGVAAIATYYLNDISEVTNGSSFAGDLVDTGWGLYFCLVAGWSLAALSVFQLLTAAPGLRRLRQPAHPPPGDPS